MKIILTHDADSISKPIEHIIARHDRFTKQDLKAAEKGTINLYNNIEEIVQLETELGFHSTFFIPAFLFNLHTISDTLKRIQREGAEIQLHYVHEQHPQYEGLFAMQKEFLMGLIGPVDGVRCHNLWVTEALLKLFHDNGFCYDSSYRAETVDTVEPFAIHENLIEIPIGIMDTDLFGRFHFTENEAWKYILKELEIAKDHRSQSFTLLFHQESFRMKGGRLYAELLKHFAQQSYECIRCCDLPLVQKAKEK
ncbi:MAG: hypothetical protein ACFFBX_08065 [Promethearchaeota archaeon]